MIWENPKEPYGLCVEMQQSIYADISLKSPWELLYKDKEHLVGGKQTWPQEKPRGKKYPVSSVLWPLLLNWKTEAVLFLHWIEEYMILEKVWSGIQDYEKVTAMPIRGKESLFMKYYCLRFKCRKFPVEL